MLCDCTIKQLPGDMLLGAAQDAVLENPANAPVVHPAMADILPPEHLAMMTGKYWGATGVKLTVSFLDNPDAETRRLILAHAKEWGKYANVSFVETASAGDVRIARKTNDGYWSYLGVDIKSIKASEATMNLEGFTAKTAESEYKRVVIHEFGHTLGCPHEHARPAIVALLDPAKTLAYFKRTQGWSASMIQAQILTPLDEKTLMGSDPEVGSIMCYDFPGNVTKNGQPIAGGVDLTPTDKSFIAKMYPLAVTPPPPPPPTGAGYKHLTLIADGVTLFDKTAA